MGVLVVGMHRSGTSAVASVVEALGLSFGDGDALELTIDNPRGHYESRDVVLFNERWLERLGGTWWAPPYVHENTWMELDQEDLRAARKALDFFSPDATNWFAKDPRLCLLLPLWDRLSLRFPALVVVVRSPREVAHSLRLRDGFHARRSLALWSVYYRSLLRYVDSHATLVLDYTRVLEEPESSLKALRDFLVTTGHRVDDSVPVDRLVRRLEFSLKRHSVPRLNDDGERLLAELAPLHDGLASAHLAGLPRHLDTDSPAWVEDQLGELQQLYRYRADAGQALAARDSLRAERDALMHERGLLMRQRDDAMRAAAEAQAALDAVVSSTSFRLGRKATALPRDVRDLARRRLRGGS